MPWLETAPMTQRRDFLADHRRQVFTMTELCARYGVSRKTGYKWLARYEAGGLPGLADRSRAPQHCPHRLAGSVARLLCQARRAHPSWGPRKLLQYLLPRHPEIDVWPAASTVGDLFARRGLISKRRRRRSHRHPGVVPPQTSGPNDLWTADFKGEFRTGDGIYCYPFTLADQHTRYLLACKGMASTKASPCGACSSVPSAPTGFHERSGRTTACRSPPAGSTGSRSSTSGGCG